MRSFGPPRVLRPDSRYGAYNRYISKRAADCPRPVLRCGSVVVDDIESASTGESLPVLTV